MRYQRHGRAEGRGRGMERRLVRLGRKFEGVGGEFRMLFPAKFGGAEGDVEVLVGRAGRGKAAARAEIDQGRAVSERAVAGGIESKMQHPGLRRKRGEGARANGRRRVLMLRLFCHIVRGFVRQSAQVRPNLIP